MPVTGLGPHGEHAAPIERIRLADEDADTARRRRFAIGLVLHTAQSDWAKQQIAGLVRTLGRYGASIVEVIDCRFAIDDQIAALDRLASAPLDAVISLPIGNTAVADVHARITASGKKLVLLDNAPTGLLPGSDYECVVSADNFGLGQIGARLLSPTVPRGGKIGVLGYGIAFFATNEREIAFRKWISQERPDVTVNEEKFDNPDAAEASAGRLFDAHPDLDGLYVVWDEPAMGAVSALRARSLTLPITTTDLGLKATREMASGGAIKGIGAQLPYDQGVAAGTATIAALVGRPPPAWIALPGLPVTKANVIESYQLVWHNFAPRSLIDALRQTPGEEV